MSGGAYGYIGNIWGMSDLLDKAGWLPEVAERLAVLGYDDAAEATQELYDRLMAEPERFKELVKTTSTPTTAAPRTSPKL